MINVDEIDKAIDALVKGETNYANCQKLANLYIVRNELQSEVTVPQDTLPGYKKYCDTKRQYQMREITADRVSEDIRSLCAEVSEFLLLLYRNTDTEVERTAIKETLQHLAIDIH